MLSRQQPSTKHAGLDAFSRQTFVKTSTHDTQIDYKQGNSYDCCHRFYGAPEYPMLIDPDETSYRAVDKYLFADSTKILADTAIVDKEV